ncbi:endonuclease/exonuclease/phosphatase family protein [Rhodopirellula sp.]|nr:endonuclease/exonuclease/phosphatase family protein [Rhodopirellula sp.]
MSSDKVEIAGSGWHRRLNEQFAVGVSRCCWLLVGGLSVCSFATFFASHFWIADLLANLRVQQIIGGFSVLVIGLLIRQWRLALITCALVALHLPWLFKAFPHASNSKNTRHAITVTSVNVLSENLEYDLVVADLLKTNADVFAVLELTPAWDQKLRQQLPAYSYVISRSENVGDFGVGVYSKYPLGDIEVFQAVEAIDSLAVTVEVERSEDSVHKFRLFVTHPLPPMNPTLFEARNHQLRDVAERIQKYRQQPSEIPVVLLGDLNLTPWSPWFAEFQSQSGLVRGISRFTIEPTWYRFSGFPFGLVLDHGLIDPSLVCTQFQVGGPIGSDHRSITLRIAFEE